MVDLLIAPFAFFAGFLVFGTWAFWAVTGAAFLTLIALTECERTFTATSLAIIIVGLTCFANGINPFTWTMANPDLAFGSIVGYVVVGALYGVLKWWSFLRKILAKYNEIKTEFLRSQNMLGNVSLPTIPEELKGKWAERLDCEYGELRYIGRGQMPSASAHKGKILAWMAWWPMSLTWLIINDPVKEIFQYVYEKLGTTMQRISAYVFKDIKADLESNEERTYRMSKGLRR
jgi:hypothetical protein